MIRKLNFDKVKELDTPGLLIFWKPLGAKLHRIFRLPDNPERGKMLELVQVLNTIATKTLPYAGIWFFDLRDKETQDTVFEILFDKMEIDMVSIELDRDPEYSN